MLRLDERDAHASGRTNRLTFTARVSPREALRWLAPGWLRLFQMFRGQCFAAALLASEQIAREMIRKGPSADEPSVDES